MFDLAAIDKLHEATKGPGGPMLFGLFDKRVLLPLGQLVESVKRETGETATVEVLRAKAEAGWFTLLEMPGLETGEVGAPLYAPSRIGLLLKFEREGYSPEELRIIAEMEEWSVDNLWAADELAYVDDDLDTVIRFTEDRVAAFEHAGEEPEKAEKSRKDLRFLQRLKAEGVPERTVPAIEKAAFQARAINEGTRVHLLEMDRAKVKAGYGPYVLMRSYSWGPMGGFGGGEVNWKETIKVAISYTKEGDLPSIRVPGVLLRGDRVIPTRTLRPSDYEALWKERDLEGYLKAWSEVRGERCCLNCFTPLESGAERKRFCSERCRNATKQRRHREQNPEAVERAQKKYWETYPVDGEG